MESETTVNPATPDWSAIDEEIECPLCTYNLRGLTEPRCPECGYRFTWPEIIDPTQRLHPYLFEHHPERNVKSFWQTAIGGLRPRRFWSALHPAQPSALGRLILYWGITACVFLVGLSCFTMSLTIDLARGRLTTPGERARWIAYYRSPAGADSARVIARQWRMPIDAFIELHYPTQISAALLWQTWRSTYPMEVIAGQGLIALAWPWLTFVTLLIFGISMRRARVRRIHVLRCSLYSADILVWMSLMLFGTLAINIIIPGSPGPRSFLRTLMSWTGGGFALVGALIWLWRLRTAYARYLRFDHPFLTVLASQIIVTLLVPTLFLGWALLFH